MIDNDEVEMSECTRCADTVDAETLVIIGDARICEICWDDL
jgi:hypothetical protein